ncbi:hypothetical protein Metho_0584 [Methanomethylovorans hollandica DSM 15978]|jgi:hypothetical protein|uniref:Uncharacterized protein n=1 Tax=Methanomethylovorans hollandica (strain DSM 15978 / NBRC 107637 / DMS1) TaxID=867904 RepID=L0KY04_METHD|nr:hypothetical protein [Methanomethylovorans hollandica]AGB48849.1 hypothetical protein Metho_0584 [Methanomethylovorans hollandica DSM 15978]
MYIILYGIIIDKVKGENNENKCLILKLYKLVLVELGLILLTKLIEPLSKKEMDGTCASKYTFTAPKTEYN